MSITKTWQINKGTFDWWPSFDYFVVYAASKLNTTVVNMTILRY